ncbi:hypothetical protein [Methylobacterium frigidaeris]|uniref:hypothetical protein n=1 Tax=Methylobacterium frigidaeris TaxID=2038277 RepID=UPI001EDF8050|nr:hypothetical protein [Methylobacterium frigidaeris]
MRLEQAVDRFREGIVVAAGGRLDACSGWRTQFLNVSPEQPIVAEIDWIADHYEPCSLSW